MAQKTLWQPSDIQNADSSEAETPKRRGRIPQSAWPRILERHRAGATLSAIAREFDCTPSAISYIIRKAEAAGVHPGEAEAGEASGESPAVQESATEAPATEAEPAESPVEPPAGPATGPQESQAAEEPPASTPVPAAESQPPSAMGEPRREARTRAGTGPSGRSRLGLSPQGGEPRRPSPRADEEAPAPVSPPEERPVEARVAEQPGEEKEAPPARNGAQPAGRSEPVDAIEARLRDTARSCLVAYRGWRQQPGEGSIQGLSDAMHELRKALARIEIEMSAHRREEQALRPIPIPAHRAARRPR